MIWILREKGASFDIKNKKKETPHNIVKDLPEKYSKLFLPYQVIQ